MSPILIIGYGNPLRSDDGLGWHVAQQLANTLASPEVQVIAAHQLTPELAEPASLAALVIFIDASLEAKPGEIVCTEVSPANLPGYSHHLSPSAVLNLSQELYGRCPRGYVLSVGGEAFDQGEALSPTVRASLEPLIDRVHKLMAEVR